MFIVLEGIDGSGTTTQVQRVAATLRANGHTVHETQEPSGGPIGRMIREILSGEKKMDPSALALLFAADRLDHVSREIQPKLNSGMWVLCDRYLGSSLAYQSQFCPLEWVVQINAKAREPDLTILLDVSPDVARARRSSRAGATELFEEDELQRNIAMSYRALPTHLGADRTKVVDGGRPPDVVEADIIQIILDG